MSTGGRDEKVSGELKNRVPAWLDWQVRRTISARIGALKSHSACTGEQLPSGRARHAAG
ncbi:MAG: hypothetical protein H0U72_13490 [Nitrosospira sp.]|nr:hypothetical protein [Nitrosospira sp.]